MKNAKVLRFMKNELKTFCTMDLKVSMFTDASLMFNNVHERDLLFLFSSITHKFSHHTTVSFLLRPLINLSLPVQCSPPLKIVYGSSYHIMALPIICLLGLVSHFLTRGYAKRRNGFLLGLRYANVSLAHSGVESS